MAKSIASVGYIRMSTDKQETSPEQQRIEIQRYAAANGYTILKWYDDLGISGDKTEKRIGFQKMIADASDGRFKAILCWDQDRFGRFDSLESGYWIHPLRQNQVQLVTCTDGPVDWNTFAGRMLYGMKQEGKHQYLVDLSNNVSRRMKQIAADGLWVTGKPPVGYVLGPDRKLQLGPAEDVQLVRDVFASYIAGKTTRQLTTMVNERGYRSSRGTSWSVPGLTAMLKNNLYTGCLTYGKRQLSKYQPKTTIGKFKDKADWIVIENSHEPIISLDTFNTCQQLLKERKRHTSPGGTSSQFVLSGLLRCSHCGSSMHGDTYNNCTHYTCGTYKSRPGSCERYNIRQPEMLQILLKELRTRLFKPDVIKRVRAEMVRKLQQPAPTRNNPQLLLDAIDVKIEAAEHRLVEVSKDMIPRVEAQIRQLLQQRSALEAQAADQVQQPTISKGDVFQRVDAAMVWFKQLEKVAAGKYSNDKMRQLLSQFIEKVELRFERNLWGKSTTRYKCSLAGGVIHFRFMGVEHIGPLIRDI